MKKLSLLLAVVMLLTSLSFVAVAEEFYTPHAVFSSYDQVNAAIAYIEATDKDAIAHVDSC